MNFLRKRYKKYWHVLLLVVCMASYSTAQKVNYKNQDRGELESQRSQILAEIKETQSKLSALQKDKHATMAQLNALQTKLAARQALIGNINKEINLLESNIDAANKDVQSLTLTLEEQKKKYAELIRYTYKTRNSQSVILFLFSAKNFNDAIRRYNYVKQYRDYRKQQADNIKGTKSTLDNRIQTLAQEKQQKDLMLNQQVQQQQVLAAESQQKNAVVQDLKGQEKNLLANIANKKKTADAMNKAINAAIRREIEIARKKAEEERRREIAARAEEERRRKADVVAKKQAAEEERRRQQEEERQKALALKTQANKKASTLSNSTNNGNKSIAGNNAPSVKPSPRIIGGTNSNDTKPPTATASSTASNYNNDLSNDQRTLSFDFESNRGNLSSPVSGYICSHFGKNKHPIFNVVEENYGIDIRTAKGAAAKSVFGGEVSSVFFIAGAGNCVMINHGNYFTVYSKLEKVSVSKGQKISARTAIGTVMTDAEGNNQMHFEIWKVGSNGVPNKINPEPWIRL